MVGTEGNREFFEYVFNAWQTQGIDPSWSRDTLVDIFATNLEEYLDPPPTKEDVRLLASTMERAYQLLYPYFKDFLMGDQTFYVETVVVDDITANELILDIALERF